ncbi:MAG: DUF4976 domain-containing protein [Candidatus Sumerlaeota bacterium]|nr:DUF4976 domain-containing protein [Candidatus Sumerlaeota bacterium]
MAKQPGAKSLPLSPQVLESQGVLGALDLGAEAFDPKGAWNQTYAIWVGGSDPRAQIDAGKPYNMLEIERVPGGADGGFTLRVRESLPLERTGGRHETTAEIARAGDALATPLSWRLRAQTFDLASGKEIERVRVEKDGEVGDGSLVTRCGGRTVEAKLASKEYKYIAYADDPVEQLFDLKNDPGEMKNLADDPAHAAVLKEYRDRLSEWDKGLERAPPSEKARGARTGDDE